MSNTTSTGGTNLFQELLKTQADQTRSLLAELDGSGGVKSSLLFNPNPTSGGGLTPSSPTQYLFPNVVNGGAFHGSGLMGGGSSPSPQIAVTPQGPSMAQRMEIERLTHQAQHSQNELRRLTEEYTKTNGALQMKLNSMRAEMDRQALRNQRLETELSRSVEERQDLVSDLSVAKKELLNATHTCRIAVAEKEEAMLQLESERRERSHSDSEVKIIQNTVRLKDQEIRELRKMYDSTKQALEAKIASAASAQAAQQHYQPPAPTPVAARPPPLPMPTMEPASPTLPPPPPSPDPALVEIIESNAGYIRQAETSLRDMEDEIEAVYTELLELKVNLETIGDTSKTSSTSEGHTHSISEGIARVRKRRASQRALEMQRRQSMEQQMERGLAQNHVPSHPAVKQHVSAFGLVYDLHRLKANVTSVMQHCREMRQIVHDAVEAHRQGVTERSEHNQTLSTLSQMEAEAKKLMVALDSARADVRARDSDHERLLRTIAEEKEKTSQTLERQQQRHTHELTQLQAEHQEMMRRVQDENSKLRDLLTRMENELADVGRQKAQLVEEVENQKLKRKAAKNVRERLEHELSELKMTNVQWNRELRAAREDIKQKESDLLALQDALREVGEEEASARMAHAALRIAERDALRSAPVPRGSSVDAPSPLLYAVAGGVGSAQTTPRRPPRAPQPSLIVPTARGSGGGGSTKSSMSGGGGGGSVRRSTSQQHTPPPWW
eukprot:PhF_6_TR17006/c0_g1_i1/m.25755